MKSKPFQVTASLFLALALLVSTSLPVYASQASDPADSTVSGAQLEPESTADTEEPAVSQPASAEEPSSAPGSAASSSAGETAPASAPPETGTAGETSSTPVSSAAPQGQAPSADDSASTPPEPAPAIAPAGDPTEPELQTDAGRLPATATVIPQDTLTVSASNERTETHPATNAVDGNPATLWHTTVDVNPPFDYFVDMGEEKAVSHIEITGRKGSSNDLNGFPGQVDVYTSEDGVTYTAKAAAVDWSDVSLSSGMVCVIEISPAVTTRYLKLDIKDTKIVESKYKPAAVAELNLYYASPFAGLEALIEEAEELLETLEQEEDITLLEDAIAEAKEFLGLGDATNVKAAEKALQDTMDAIRQHLLGKQTVTSPDGAITVGFWLDEDGRPWYEVEQNGSRLVEASSLGLTLAADNGGDMTTGLTLVDVEETTVDTHWEPAVQVTRGNIPDVYSQSVFQLKDEAGRRVNVVFRAYDEGVGFRYVFPDEDNTLTEFVIEQEASQFSIPDDTTAYYLGTHSQAIPKQAMVQALNAEHYTPMVFSYASGTSMALFESDLYDYARLKLRSGGSGTLTSNIKWGNATVAATAPFASPWRGMIVADSLGGIQEKSYMVQNLSAELKIEDPSWIKTGKLIREAKLTEENTKKCIDFAVENNIDYVMYDSGWYGTENNPAMSPMEPFIGEFPYMMGGSQMRRCDVDVRDAARWGAEKGVGIILYVNHIHLENYDLDEVFRTYQEWGIKGVKFGFVNVGNQYWSKWLADAVATAAKYQLVVKIHDEYIPTGLDRAYPNLLNIEGVLGDEGSPNYTDDLKQVFTRTFLGPADHTFCYPMMQYRGAIKTDAYSLASPMLYFAPLHSLYWYGGPDDYEPGSYPERKFWADLPGEWDESHHVDSSYGEYFTMARRTGDDWFLGSLSAIVRSLEFTPDFLQPGTTYVAECYTNSPGDTLADNTVAIHRFLVDSTTQFSFPMIAGGGLSLRMVPATQEEIENTPPYSRNRPHLENLVAAAELLDADVYTTRSLKASGFDDALQAAKAVLAKEVNPEETYQQAQDQLQAAMNLLVEKSQFALKLDQSELTVHASSDRPGTHEAGFTLDGNLNTIWHTAANLDPPFDFFIDLGEERLLKSIELTGRSDNGPAYNGYPLVFDICISEDGESYETYYSIDWRGTNIGKAETRKAVLPKAVRTRYVQLHITYSHLGQGSPYRPASLAELNVYEAPFGELDSLIDQAGYVYRRLEGAAEQQPVSAAIEEAVHYTETAESLDGMEQHLQALEGIVDQYTQQTDKDALEKLFDSCRALEEVKYTPESWGVLTQQLDNAAYILKDFTAPQDEVDEAVSQLEQAHKALVLRTDKTTLQALYDKYSALLPDAYTNESWKPFAAARDAAKAALANEKATQAVVDGARAALQTAADGLELKPNIVLVQSVTLNHTSLSLETGRSQKLNASVNPANATNKAVSWQSSDPTVAKVDANGTVTAMKQGSATITVTTTEGSKTARCTVQVADPYVKVSQVALNMSRKDMQPGKKLQLKATVSPANATDQHITWTSSNPKVAAVDKKGIVTAKKEGTATITAAAGGKKDTVRIRVNAKYTPVSKVSLSRRSISMNVKGHFTLQATVSPAKASLKTVYWTSSNPDVARVNSRGTVTAKSPGKAVITATSHEGGKLARCTVTVKPAVTKLTLSKTKLEVTTGAVRQLKTFVSPGTAKGTTAIWKSSNPKVATVTSSGRVKAIKPGKATITATVGGKKVTCRIVVK